MDEFDDLLLDYVFGRLPASGRARLEEQLAKSPTLRAELESLESTVAALGDAPFTAPSLLGRLTHHLAGPERLFHLAADVASLFDVSLEVAQRLLAEAVRGEGFEEGLAPGVLVKPVEAGASRLGAFTALVKVEPGSTYPWHAHGGEEKVLVLEGGYRDSAGAEVWRGELDVREAGTEHSFTALEGPPCICAAVSYPPGGD